MTEPDRLRMSLSLDMTEKIQRCAHFRDTDPWAYVKFALNRQLREDEHRISCGAKPK
jgi:hypothetical protein